MRFIPTTAEAVESLKKQAKKLQRKSGGKHTEALDRVARGAGYNHWHHVTLCLNQGSKSNPFDALKAECALMIEAARTGVGKMVLTGPNVLKIPLLLFACEGDAWMLEPRERKALCLMFRGELQSYQLKDTPNRIEIEWDGDFELAGQFFKVITANPAIGSLAIAGFPVEQMRELLAQVETFDQKFSDIFMQADAIDLTPETIQELVRNGWKESDLTEAADSGARYSPQRNSLIFPAFTDVDGM